MIRAEQFESFANTSELKHDLKRAAVRGFTSVATSSGGEFVLRIASTAILARLIAPEQFGLFIMVTAFTAIADQFRDLGLSAATIQRETLTFFEVSNLFWVNTFAGAALTVLGMAFAPLLAAYYHEPRLTSLTVVFSVNFLCGGLVVQHEALLTRQMRLGPKALSRLVANFVSTALAVVLAWWGWGPWALVWREVCRSVLIVIGVFLICPLIPGLPSRNTDIRSLLHFGKDVTGSNILATLSSSLDRLLIGRFFGAAPVALYRQPYQLVVSPIQQFMWPLYQVTMPSLSMLQTDEPRFRRFYLRVVAMVAMLSMPLSVFLAIYAQEVTLVILGRQWAKATVFLRIFAVGGIIRSVSSIISFVLVSRGNSRPYLALGIANSMVIAILMCVGVIWGPLGVAVGEGLTLCVMFGPLMFYSFRGSPISIQSFLSALCRPAVASAVMGVILVVVRFLWPLSTPYRGLTLGVLVASAALLAAWLILPGGRSELRQFRNDIFGAIRRRTGMKGEVAVSWT